MSIIYDALKKTQQYRENINNPNSLYTKFRYAIWGAELILAVVLGAFILSSLSHHSRGQKHAANQSVSPAKVAAVATAPVKKAVEAANPPSVLATKLSTAVMPPAKVETKATVVAAATPPVAASKAAPIVMPPLSLASKMPAASAPVVNQQSAISLTPPASLMNEAEFKNKHILNGVFLSHEEKIALINNQAFHIGDTVENMKIVSISLNQVTLRDGKNTLQLRVAI